MYLLQYINKIHTIFLSLTIIYASPTKKLSQKHVIGVKNQIYTIFGKIKQSKTDGQAKKLDDGLRSK